MNKYLIIAICTLTAQTAFSSQPGKIVALTVTNLLIRENAQQKIYMHSTQTVADLTKRLSTDHPVCVGIRIFKNGGWRYESLADKQQTLDTVLLKYPTSEFYSIRNKTQLSEFSIGIGDNL